MKLFDSNDRSLELPHLATACAVPLFFFLTGWTVIVQDKPFDGQTFGIGFLALLGGFGAGAVCQGMQRNAQGPAA